MKKWLPHILDHASDIIYTCDLDGHVTYANTFASELMGIPSENLIGIHFIELIADSHKEEVATFYERQKKNATPNTYFEFPIRTKPGNVLWIGQNVSIYTSGDGKPQGIIAIARPITKLKTMESSLSESEARLKTVIDSALDAVIVINEQGRITEWNRQAELTFGWTRDWIIGRRLSETIIPQVHRKGHEQGMKHFLKTGEGPVLNKRIEIVAQNKKGVIFPVELTIIPNKIKDTYFFSAFVRDITEVKKSERALKAINDLAISLLGKNTLNEIAWEITKNTIDKFGFEDCVIYVVDHERGALRQIAAYGAKNPEAEVIMSPIDIKIGAGIVGSVAANGKAILIEDTSTDSRYIVDDEPRLSELTVPIIADGEVIGIIDSEHSEKGFFKEEHLKSLTTVASLVSTQLKNAIIQERKLIAEKALKRANDELSEFAHVVSHDLKAPLRAISSLSEWIAEDYEDKLDANGKSYLMQLVNNVDRMDQLIDGILTYSTADNSIDLAQEIDSAAYIQKVISTLSVPSHTTLHVEGEFPTITYNKIQFQQIVQNLLSNAIKFVDAEEGLVHIRCISESGCWTFSISDNGNGIPEDVGNQIFKLFVTDDDEQKRSTGIGLSIVKKIVDQNGGKVWYQNNSDRGATFYFTVLKTQGKNEKPEIHLTS